MREENFWSLICDRSCCKIIPNLLPLIQMRQELLQRGGKLVSYATDAVAREKLAYSDSNAVEELSHQVQKY